jgi:hypothetical protein
MSEPCFKGMAYINLRDWFDERLGAGWYARTAREVDPEWPDRLLPGEWYSVRPGLHCYAQGFEQLDGYQSLEHLMETVAGAIALVDLNGILRAFLWVATPKLFLRTTPKIWGTYANYGTAEVISNETGRLRVRVSEVPQFVLHWVMAAWRGFLGPAVQLAGGKEPKTSTSEAKQTPGAETWEFVYEMTYS